MATESAAESTIDAGELNREIRSDQDSLVMVSQAASRELASDAGLMFTPDITGSPEAGQRWNIWKSDELRGLEKLGRDPFFARVDTIWNRGKSAPEPLRVFVTAAEGVTGIVEGEGWIVVSWTSEFSKAILDKEPGSVEEVPSPRGRPPNTYEIGVSGRFRGKIAPTMRDATYVLLSGTAYVEDQSLLEFEPTAVIAAPPEPKPYTAADSFGLGEIIVLADAPQRSAMLLPFESSVLVEGPPGSGKTSIGLMRVRCLIDQQWDQLGLERGKDRPFHDFTTMRVLVFNEEMVDYLKSLAASIGITNVSVQTTKKFLQRVCRDARTLSGRERRDRVSLEYLKGRPEVLPAFWAGFQRHAQAVWTTNGEKLREELRAIGPDFVTLADEIEAWVKRLGGTALVGISPTGHVSLAARLNQTADTIRQGRSPTRTPNTELKESALESGLRLARDRVRAFTDLACDRVAITRQMFETDEYERLVRTASENNAERAVVGDRMWRRQYQGEAPSYSEYDLGVAAWLGNLIMLTPDRENPWAGKKRERLTHIIIDEAQDLSVMHVRTIQSMLAPSGTMTMVGDLRQNLHPLGGLQSWDDLGPDGIARGAFSINYRQTYELGSFLARLHESLYCEPTTWEPATTMTGPGPRVGRVRSWAQISRAVAEEARHWRHQIEGATVAVLYDGSPDRGRLRDVQAKLEELLQDEITTVHLVDPASRGGELRDTDCVLIASVQQTKGLEFDAVVYIDTRAEWSDPVEEVSARVRNGLYVAAGRARSGLTLCMLLWPDWLEALVQQGACHRQSWFDDEDPSDD